MNARKKAEILDASVPLLDQVTKKTLKETGCRKARFRGSVRIGTSRIFVDDEFEARRLKILGTPLPHMG